MSALPTNIHELRTPLAYAKKYLQLGWWVIPLTPGTKEPLSRLVPNGVHGASNDLATIERWWKAEPNAGIGVAILKSGLVCLDVDPRNGGYDTMERLENTHGKCLSDVVQLTGGGGEHRIFMAQLVQNLPGKLGAGVDLKADGYFCAEPSIHPNGVAYGWEASSDPTDGCIPSALPGWIRDLARGPFGAVPFIPATRIVDAKQVEELREALASIKSDDYHCWVNFGNALSELGQAGFQLWDEWSKNSDKYDPQQVTRKWRSFKPGAIQIESIFFAAQQGGWLNPATIEPEPMPEPVPVEQVIVAQAPAPQPIPANLLTPPGILGDITNWIDQTSSKPQPQFAVQTAIAFAATVLGRRFVTVHRNWSSLYLLNIGKSASGKEHGKWALETLLEACDMGNLIGPSSYTSGAGLMSSLHDQPTHVTVIDEFGKELEQSSVKGNSRAQSTMKSLIECWGRCDGVMRPQGYSTVGLSAKDAAAIKERCVRNPALTMLAMTVPESFFDSIGSAAARDGFLNRFLIVESDIGRQINQMAVKTKPPQAIIDWATTMHALSAGLVNVAMTATLEPTPIEVDITASAMELFRAFDAECISLMDDYEECGLAEMFGRCNEMAMRLALVVAAGRHMTTPMEVDGPDAAWAIQYVRFNAIRTTDRLKASVADSEFEASKKQIYHLILKSGERGMTERDLNKSSRRFAGMTQRQQIELLNSMRFVGEIDRIEAPAEWGAGKRRIAWVATNADTPTGYPPATPDAQDD
jgi:hypothetical protein